MQQYHRHTKPPRLEVLLQKTKKRTGWKPKAVKSSRLENLITQNASEELTLLLSAKPTLVNRLCPRMKNGKTLLHAALFYGKEKLVQLLLDQGCNPNLENDAGLTPLELAAAQSLPEEFQLLLLERGAHWDFVIEKDLVKAAYFEYLICTGYLRAVTYLLTKGADVQQQFPISLMTPLCTAITFNQEKIALLLVEHGAEVNVACGESEEMSPFVEAVERTLTKCIKAMLKQGISWSDMKTKNNNLIHIACKQKMPWLVKKLLKNGWDVNEPDKNGDTPLHFSVHSSKPISESLLKNGAEVNQENGQGETPLHKAIEGRRRDIIEMLLEQGADSNQQMHEGKQPFFCFLEKMSKYKEPVALALVRSFLAHGALTTKPDEYSYSAFEHALSHKYYTVAGVLSSTKQEKAILKRKKELFQSIKPRKKEVRKKGLPCPVCGAFKLEDTDMRVDHGNPATPASDTEIIVFYSCRACTTKFWTFAYLPHSSTLYTKQAIYSWDHDYWIWKTL